MAGERLELAARRLAALIGPQNVLKTGETVVVKPSSAGEIAGIMDIAHKEEIPVETPKYLIGPAKCPVTGPRIVLSLEKMNSITVDRIRHSILAGPAAGTALVIKTALEYGFVFPGNDCLHQGETIGENVVECFEDGEPHFKCRTACLCGLDLVLAGGRLVTVGESGIKDMDNYHLSFILSGYRESAAVIAGVHLKMTPAQKGGCLVAAGVDLAKAAEALSLLLEELPGGLQEVVLLNSALCDNTPAGFKFRHLGEACLVFKTEGDHTSLDFIMKMIGSHCGQGDQGEAYIAGDSYQRAVLSGALDSLRAFLEDSPDYIREIIPGPKDICRQERLKRLASITWTKGGSWSVIFYNGQY
ncbi:MAG: hypothetical protein M1130_04525 [Actinobacteria bacterium]|nr:hypothetical protein [Actinomycetota bacterium]